MMLVTDPQIRSGLAKALAEGEARVQRLQAELAAAEADLAAIQRLLGKPGPLLRGDSLRAEAHKLLKEIDATGRGVHYQEITKQLLERGFQISGKSTDKAPNVRSTIGHGEKAMALFRPVGTGQGMYTWK
jgi:hypothetical protein